MSSPYWTTQGKLNLVQDFSWAKEKNLSKSWFPHIENSGNIVLYFLWSSGRPRRLEGTVQGSREERSPESSFWSFPKSCPRVFMWELANVCIWGNYPSPEKEKTKEKGGKMLRSHTGLGIVHIFTNWKGTHVALSGVIIRIWCYSEDKLTNLINPNKA